MNMKTQAFQHDLFNLQFRLHSKELDRDAEIQDFVDQHMDELYDHYMDNHEMPYGVAKARDGDPDQWIAERFERDFL